MTLPDHLNDYLSAVNTSFKSELGRSGGYITLYNSGIRGDVKSFQASLASFLTIFGDIEKNIAVFSNIKNYDEKQWRDEGSEHFTDLTLKSLVTVQTKPVFTTISKLIAWANDAPIQNVRDSYANIDLIKIQVTRKKLSELIGYYTPKIDKITPVNPTANYICLPKPFLLLAGISGSGKSRYVKQQANYSTNGQSKHCLVPVRPDWHEPSDILGYVSRIGETKYVPTAFLLFLVSAWKDAFSASTGSDVSLRPLDQILTFWVCLDEMNLAPVEQYFADYLSVIETRKWNGDKYSCDPLLKPSELLVGEQPEIFDSMKAALGLDGFDDLWKFFLEAGIPVPPNLIVAGTVNMDETTHGFSRKVIDRALTFDFGNFFPNDFDKYFSDQNEPKALAFSRYSRATADDLKESVPADDDGAKSTDFLKEINVILKDTPFELAYRALNELMVSLLCFKPKKKAELLAVWDDFLMCKLLPRLEGDEDKFRKNGTDVLDELLKLVQSKFPDELGNTTPRPDLLNTTHDGKELLIAYRSPAKLQWMKNRLSGGFTSFWP